MGSIVSKGHVGPVQGGLLVSEAEPQRCSRSW